MRNLFLSSALLCSVGLLFSACSTGRRPADGGLPFKLSVSVERWKDQDRWTVTYKANRPVSELVFDRQANRFRSKNWVSKTPGIKIKDADGKEFITSETGSKFDSVTFELASYYEPTPKDYEFFQAFSDGSLVMYSGHFNACPEGLECDAPVEFSLKGRPSDNVIILGQVNAGQASWIDLSGRGTYVYFGNIKPLERKHLTAIIDPTLPKWLKDRFHQTLPRLFDFYTKETGFALTFKPFIFLNYSNDGHGTKSHGGTLPGLIQLSLSGQGWSKEDKEGFVDLARFLAHEAAHVWNGQLFPYISGDMWMHEGGADAFAYMALLKLGLVNKSTFLDFQTSALNHCLGELKGRPLKEVKEDRNFRAHYSCGAMVALVTHAAVLKKSKSGGVFKFWKELFTSLNRQQLPHYDESNYFTTLVEITNDKALSERLNVFINGPTKSSNDLLVQELEQSGVSLALLEKNPPKEYQKNQAMDLIRLLMREDCDNRHSLSATSEGIETGPVGGCRTFKERFLVTHVGPHPIKMASAAYDYVYDLCEKNSGPIELKAKDVQTPYKVACPRTMPKRPHPYGIASIPL